MLENLHIKNFRGISSLQLNDLGRVNILLGENGVGKTTTLEAVSLVSARHPKQIQKLAQWREFHSSVADGFWSIFYGLDIQKRPTFEFTLNQAKHRFVLESFSQSDARDITNGSISLNGRSHVISDDSVVGVKSNYISPDGNDSEIYYWPQVDESLVKHHKIDEAYRLGCFYIHARRATSISETAEALTRISDSIQYEDLFRDVLKSIDPRIRRIRAGTVEKSPVVNIDIGLEKMVPLSFMGDGFCRVALMLTGIMGSSSKILAVDEIDSGLHFSIMKTFWSQCITLTKQFDVQLFCTTHNEEILDAAIGAFADTPDDIKVYRLEQRTEEELYVAEFDYEMLRNSDLAGFEIR